MSHRLADKKYIGTGQTHFDVPFYSGKCGHY